ncbi:MAG: hypothetical protein LKE33_08325 [Acidaminococcus sp.]|jgi:hypothetical protein|nr:hypothetical protein [Acidaminococcus sp.]MCI2099748.1 hypothetical protein [Acidaminococcus sp.]MCI2113982.1 hypothetical protein [Acidaminococcus sp.]MCI2116091.1 hypothetical protein [Acidaminococcus sp.]
MKKLATLLLCISLLFVASITYANDITLKDCRIGPIGCGDAFDMGQMNDLFGNLIKPAGAANEYGSRLMFLLFHKSFVEVCDNRLHEIYVYSGYANNGVVLSTPRGIVVGDNLDKVLRLYGQPTFASHYKKDKDYDHARDSYVYTSSDFRNRLSFTVNSDTNQVEYISTKQKISVVVKENGKTHKIIF